MFIIQSYHLKHILTAINETYTILDVEFYALFFLVPTTLLSIVDEPVEAKNKLEYYCSVTDSIYINRVGSLYAH